MPKARQKTSGGNKGFAAVAKKYANAWGGAKTEAKDMGFTQVEDGTYIMKLAEGDVRESSNGNFGMLTKWVVASGEKKGESITRWDGLEDEEKFKWVLLYMESMGVETDTLELGELPEAIEELVKQDIFARCRVKTNDAGYTNVRVLKLVDDPGEDEAAEVPKKGKKGKKAEEEEPEPEGDDEPEPEGDDEPEAYKPKKGDQVSFTHKSGKELKGEITSCPPKAKSVVVTTAKGNNYQVPVKDLVSEAEPEEPEPEAEGEGEEAEVEVTVGQDVVFKIKGKEVEGKVKAVNQKKKMATIVYKGAKHELAFDDFEVLVAAD